MMKSLHNWKWLFVISLLWACGSSTEFNEPEAPANVIAQDTYIQLLTEVHLIEGAMKQRVFRNDDQKTIIAKHYAELFDRKGVTEERFLATYNWWYARPEALDAVLEEVAENLTELERDINAEDAMINASEGQATPTQMEPSP